MLGWWIVISMQTPEERDRADQDTRRAALLANWEASVNGSRWVHQLVEQGKATQLSSGGYPNRFTAKACDVLPLLANGVPKHDGPRSSAKITCCPVAGRATSSSTPTGSRPVHRTSC
jgi:hypothetical protein